MLTIFRRPRLQFGLKSIFGLMLAIAICAAAYGARLRAIQRQEEAFRQIVAKGGVVHVYSYGTTIFFEKPPVGMCVSGIHRIIEPAELHEEFGDSDCHLLDDILDLQDVRFYGSRVSRGGVDSVMRKHPHCRVTSTSWHRTSS